MWCAKRLFFFVMTRVIFEYWLLSVLSEYNETYCGMLTVTLLISLNSCLVLMLANLIAPRPSSMWQLSLIIETNNSSWFLPLPSLLSPIPASSSSPFSPLFSPSPDPSPALASHPQCWPIFLLLPPFCPFPATSLLYNYTITTSPRTKCVIH